MCKSDCLPSTMLLPNGVIMVLSTAAGRFEQGRYHEVCEACPLFAPRLDRLRRPAPAMTERDRIRTQIVEVRLHP